MMSRVRTRTHGSVGSREHQLPLTRYKSQVETFVRHLFTRHVLFNLSVARQDTQGFFLAVRLAQHNNEHRMELQCLAEHQFLPD